MIKREFKVNLKNFIIWTLILCVIFLVVFLMYPSIINSNSKISIDEMVKMFPEEMLKMMNMDIASMSSAFGWLKTEGFIFVLLIIGTYSSILGSNILLKEESDKTIEYLHGLPVSRNKIILSKYIVGIFYIILMVIILGIFNYIGLSITEKFDTKNFILLSITPIFPCLIIYTLCFFISTFARKTKKMLGISIGIVFISYVLNMLSELSTNIEFLKYFSVFTLADVRNVITNSSINICYVFITIAIMLVLLILSVIRYRRKEFV